MIKTIKAAVKRWRIVSKKYKDENLFDKGEAILKKANKLAKEIAGYEKGYCTIDRLVDMFHQLNK